MKNKSIILTILAFITISVISSCKKDYIDWEKLRKAEIADRNKYLAEHNINVKPTETGLYYIETKKGTGLKPTTGRNVTVKYIGKLLNGKVIDSNDNFKFEFNMEKVIKGWDEGIGYMRKGGKATLIIPSKLAYGAYGDESADIPKYSTLVFDVELINVQ